MMNCLSSLLLVSTSAAFQTSRRLTRPRRLDRRIHNLGRQPKQSPALSASFTPSFCEVCGSKMEQKIPPGDERERSVCTSCGHISYQNPKVVVGTICTFGDKVLLCKRAIEPCMNKWGYPQGFMENGETTRQGAARECFEEAGVSYDPSKAQLIAVYNLAGMQIQTIYRVELECGDKFEETTESSEVRFFAWNDIPWSDIAFATVEWGLEHARSMKDEIVPTVQERTKIITEDGQWRVQEL